MLALGAGPAGCDGVLSSEPALRAEMKFFGRHKGGAVRDGVLLSVGRLPASSRTRPNSLSARVPKRQSSIAANGWWQPTGRHGHHRDPSVGYNGAVVIASTIRHGR